MQEGKMVVWKGFTTSWGKKRSEKPRRKGKIYPTKYRVPENNKETQAFLNEQWKETEENNRMRISSRKLRYWWNISWKNGHKKEQNVNDLTEAEEIKKRW